MKHLRQTLERDRDIFAAVYTGITEDEARWKPASDRWSLLEILGHLLDEEREDFRTRVRSTLENPAQPWPPIDPEEWARSRDYNQRDPGADLREFLDERQASLDWLASLDHADWETAHEHPKLGTLRAGDLLTAWAVHDQLHLAQIARTRAAWAETHAASFHARYASP
jgi:hypothetical protein